MEVWTLGDGDPEITVVGAVHGDEPCGARAIERILAEDPPIQRPTAFVVANEKALREGTRYVDVDLNRVMPGDPSADAHERRLAADLVEQVSGTLTLGIHSTQSWDGTFGVLSEPTERKRALFDRTHVSRVIDTTAISEGRCVDQPQFVDVEVGPQGTERATDRAMRATRSFLQATDTLPSEPADTATEYYEVTGILEKDPGATYEFLAPNFERVSPGETYARKDGDPLVADAGFWPVLASGSGHDTILGYRAQRRGE
jgi:predicted deacylase